ncbi:MAG: outer membrane protein assembly factor BamE [Pseudomonadota bacterium]
MPKIPRVHKLQVQQGNVITQQMIDKLKPGMTRSQVAFVMGEPVVRNAFNDDRWDYVYSIELPGVFSSSQLVSLFFVEDQLAYFTGDMIPTAQSEAIAAAKAAEEEAAATDQASAETPAPDQASTEAPTPDQASADAGVPEQASVDRAAPDQASVATVSTSGGTD